MTARPANSFNAEEILAGILEWVRVESPTHHVGGVNRMMDLASAAMAKLGAKIVRAPGAPGYGDVVTARLPWGRDDEPGILVLGHLDTVHPIGTIDGPLPIRRTNDQVWGPGIFDMKGGMYLAVHALTQIVRVQGRTPLPVTFMFIPDEEVGSPSTRAQIEAEARRHRYVLVPEPSQGGNLVTGRHAFLRYKLHMYGKPAHAGVDNRQGRSAIRAMARLIERIEAMSDLDRGMTYSVGIIQGGTFVNVVPIECHAELLAVAPTVEDFAMIQRTMAALAPDDPEVRLAVEPGPIRPLFTAHDGTLALYETARRVALANGFAVGHGQRGGGSDGNFTGALGIATLDGLGVCGAGLHTHNEHLLVSSLEPRARLLAGLFETLGN
ncbi:MAG: M20/M25/M40 family metallo-hydrolase [Alphaproteobacteria bacterium]|nr:M20/M25/M40 family metallo-hydrolase [Alphaproteobacteria bacterium]